MSPESDERSSDRSKLLSGQFQTFKSSVVQDVHRTFGININFLDYVIIGEDFNHEGFVVAGGGRDRVARTIGNHLR